MKRHWIYDQWGPAQKIPVAICGLVGAIPVLAYLFDYASDPKLALLGVLMLAVVASTQRCGHLALRINHLEDRLDQLSGPNEPHQERPFEA